MDFFYYGIDGTGPYGDAEYERAFKNSFVNRFGHSFGWRKSGYERGPGLLGGSTRPSGVNAAKVAASWVGPASGQDENRDSKFLVLAGYSRGGAAIIHSCNLLKQKGISVDLLLLFDAVDRAVDVVDVMVVPNNVKQVFHARRHPKSRSRTTFGNCGTSLEPGPGGARPMAYVQKFFHGTHGAIGGTPWKPQEPDVGAQSIAKKMATASIIPKEFKIIGGLMDLKKIMDIHNGKRQPNLIEEHEGFATTVTYQKDVQASKDVGAWMRSNLQRSMTWSCPLPGNGRAWA